MDKYTKGYLTYIEETKDIDMSEQYEFFMQYVPKGSKILDAGFGSGRDIAFFKQHYDVTGIDLSQEFVDYVKTNIHQNVCQMDILNLKFDNEFDAIWACASLVHFDEVTVTKALQEFAKALKSNGVLYISLKTQKEGSDLDHKIIKKEGALGLFLKQNFELKNNIRSQSMYNNQNWISMIFLKLDSNLLEAK